MSKYGPLIIDCDTGRDDALTLWLTLALKLPLAGVVTSYGNTILENVTDNTLRVLALAGREDVPVMPGAEGPLRSHKGFEGPVRARQEVSGNGICNLDLPQSARALPAPLSPDNLAGQVIALADKNGPLDYLIIGPATNFAAMLETQGEAIKKAVKRVTMMGGRLDDLWEQTPEADFNLICDPCAVRKIWEHGYEIRFVPLNATWPIKMDLPEIEALQAPEIIAKTAKELMIAHCRHFAPEPVFRFHDPSVIMAVLHPEGFESRRMDIDCAEAGPTFGRLGAKADGFACEIYQTGPAEHTSFRSNIIAALGLKAD